MLSLQEHTGRNWSWAVGSFLLIQWLMEAPRWDDCAMDHEAKLPVFWCSMSDLLVPTTEVYSLHVGDMSDPEEETVGFKFPSTHHPQPALLSNQTNWNMGCSSFISKEWVGKFTVTKIHSNLISFQRTHQNSPHSARYVSKYFQHKGFCKACCETRSSVWILHWCKKLCDWNTTVQFQNRLRKYIKLHYKSHSCHSLDSRHLEIFAGVERTEERNSNLLFCFIWKVVYSLISLRQ